MKPETSERLFIEDLFRQSVKDKKISIEAIESIERLTGDASTRRYYRIFCTKTTYVVCLDNPSEEENLFVKKQRFLEANAVRVPKVLDCIPLKGYILEEDLGDITLLHDLTRLNNLDDEKDVYQKVLDQLIAIHKIDVADSNLFLEKFDEKKLMDEINFTNKFFLKLFLKNEDKKNQAVIAEEFRSICKRVSNKKMCLTHRDFHSRNIMKKNGDLVVIDFQDARMGIPQYDLASLLDDCYYSLDSKNREILLRYYFDQMKSKLSDQLTYEEFINNYNEIALQRVFKAVGSFSYIYELRKDERYLKYIGFAMEKIKKILFSNSKYDELRKALFEVYYAS
jgi:aminoglycoside/choline kinase family phosphotransferase